MAFVFVVIGSLLTEVCGFFKVKAKPPVGLPSDGEGKLVVPCGARDVTCI